MARDNETVRQHINNLKTRWLEQYPATWQHMVADWQADEPTDCAWLMYSANYLLRTGGVRWAIDPLALKSRVPQAPEVDLVGDLDQLSFVLLTHRHADHLDLQLIHGLRKLPIWWIIPEFLYPPVVETAGIPKSRVVVPEMLEQIQISGITITPFTGLHWEYRQDNPNQSSRGVSSAGYLAEFQQMRCLFPGDTRTYDAAQLPSFGPVDLAFAHLWLGRRAALLEQPPLLDAFCTFFLDLQPSQLIVTHLNELGREPEDYWDQHHFDLVRSQFQRIAPDLPVSATSIGNRVVLKKLSL